jgi:imidazolonepropionase
MGDAGAERLAASSTLPTLLPGTSFFLGMERFAPGRWMVDRGLPVALATDLNPGSSMIASMPLVTTLACLGLRLRPAEALVAATRNAAHAAGVGAERGWIGPGALADLQIVELPSAIDLPYQVGPSFARWVFKRGVPVVRDGSLVGDAFSH